MRTFRSSLEAAQEKVNKILGNVPGQASEKWHFAELAKLHKERDKLTGEMRKLSDQLAQEDGRFHNPDGLRRRLAEGVIEGDWLAFKTESQKTAALAAMMKFIFSEERRTHLTGLSRTKGDEITALDRRIAEVEKGLLTAQSELAS